MNNDVININEDLPTSDQWLLSQGVIMQDPEKAINNLIHRAKSKQVTTLREKGFMEHQNGNYDEAVEIFKKANEIEKEKQTIKHQISPRLQTPHVNNNRKKTNNNKKMLQNNGKKVVVFTEQPLFGFTKMEKGSIVGNESSKYNPETSHLNAGISPRATSGVVKTESFFARSAQEREKYTKYLLEKKRIDAINIEEMNRKNRNNNRRQLRKKKLSGIEKRDLKEKKHQREIQKLYVANGCLLNDNNGAPYNFVDDGDDINNDMNNNDINNPNYARIGGVNIKTGKRYYRRKGQKKRGAGKNSKVLQIPSVNRLEQGSKELPRGIRDESLILKNER